MKEKTLKNGWVCPNCGSDCVLVNININPNLRALKSKLNYLLEKPCSCSCTSCKVEISYLITIVQWENIKLLLKQKSISTV